MKDSSAYQHIIFDMDGTLTPSRAPMDSQHAALFLALCSERNIAVITGQDTEHMEQQLPPQRGAYYALSRQGNWTLDKSGQTLWQERVAPEQEAAVKTLGRKLTDEFLHESGLALLDPYDIFENRVSQLATSVVGFHAPNELKYAVDPDQSKRQALLARHVAELEHLRGLGIEAMPAGTTTIDFILLGKHKGYNIERLLKHAGWRNEDCLYVGDALFPGGNDEAVVGVIDTHPVKDPRETFAFVVRVLG